MFDLGLSQNGLMSFARVALALLIGLWMWFLVNRNIALNLGANPDSYCPYGGVNGKDRCKNPSDA